MKLAKKNLDQRLDHVYDAIIVGGGMGGLSAAIYLQRYRLSCLVVEKGRGRSFWMQNLTNYLGLPPDTRGLDILQQGQEHLLSLGGDHLRGFVEDVHDEGDTLTVKVKLGKQDSVYPVFRSRYLIAASGIIDQLPQLADMQNVYDYAGYNLHVCLICDGHEMTDKRCGLFVNTEAAINTAFVLNWFTPYVTVFIQGQVEVGAEMRQKLQDHGFPLVETPIRRFLGQDHEMTGVELEDGSTIDLETGLVAMGSHYYNEYLKGLNLEWKGSNLVTDSMCRTSHPRIFAIGDLKEGLNQVSIAVADGTLAATAIWREIRRASPPRRWEKKSYWSFNVTQTDPPNLLEIQAEVARLREELQVRDQLVQQLSQELFRLVKGNANFMPSPEVSERHLAEMRALREQLQGVEQQVTFYQEQIAARDAEIYQLRQSVQELTDRSRMLEQVVQELPRIYREKFAERMAPVKEKVALIQRENRQLHAELQSVSYRLAVRNRRTTQIDLPSFPRIGAGSRPIATFGNI